MDAVVVVVAIAVALAALDAKITIAGSKGERSISVVDFFHPLGNTLEVDEMIKDIQIPITVSPTEQRFLKFTLRKPDFAIVSVAASIGLDDGVCTERSAQRLKSKTLRTTNLWLIISCQLESLTKPSITP